MVDAATFAGLDGASFSQASNSGTMFIKLSGWDERSGNGLSADALSKMLTGAMGGEIQEANVFVIAPPAVPGLGTGNGFTMMIQDRSGSGYHARGGATLAMMGAAAQSKDVTQVF